jgi:hypothetical protein
MRSACTLVLLGSFVVLSSARPLDCQPSTPAQQQVTIEGIVVDSDHAPVASAEVGLKLAAREPVFVRTGPDGRFTFGTVSLIPGTITVRRLGYHVRTVTLDLKKLATAQPLELALETVATEVESVIVDASGGRMAEFQDHRQHSSFGRFFDQNDIRKLSPRFVSELFRSVPGASVQVASGIGNVVRLRGCRPRIWVNGAKTQDAEIDELTQPSEIDGIEIYPSWAGTPPQYMDRENRACGTVVLWTRR